MQPTITPLERAADGAAGAPSRRVTPPSASPRLPSLTGLRFVAAALVFLFHGGLEFLFRDPGAQESYLFGTASAGFVGVSFFFALSGFVLAWSARPGDSAPRFWRRRFAKILPNHVVTFVLALVLLAWTGASTGVLPALANLLLVHSWVPDIAYVGSANDVSWSLSVEAAFYLVFPLLFALANRIRPNRLWYWAGGTAVMIVLMPVAAQLLLPDQPQFMWGNASFVQIWFLYDFPVVRALEFTLGILLARIVLTGRWIGLGVLPASLLVGAAYAASLYVPFLYRFAAITAIPLALLVAATAASDIKGRRSVLSTRPMVWLGEISFAFYLLHRLVLHYGHLAFGSTPDGHGGLAGPAWSTPGAVAFLAGAFAVSVLLAWALWALVERPAMRRWSVRR
ncbi:acyltransferase family protein [Streptomyces sp. SS8]